MNFLYPGGTRATPGAVPCPGGFINDPQTPRLFLGARVLFPAASADPTAGEPIPFNECTPWTGEPHEHPHGSAAFLPEIRRLLAGGKRKEAESLAALFGQYGRCLLIASGRPGGQPANLPKAHEPIFDPIAGGAGAAAVVRILSSGKQAG